MYNKTDQNLIVNLDSTFFIKNDYAIPYYQNETTQNSYLHSYSTDFTQISQKKSIFVESTGNYASQSFSVARTKERQLIIPPKSYRYVRCDFSISNEFIANKGQKKYPDDDEITTIQYSKYETPIVMRIRISYQNHGKSISDLKDFEFYVSEITNYPDDMFFEKQRKYSYDESFKSAYSYYHLKYKYLSSNRFYYLYTRYK